MFNMFKNTAVPRLPWLGMPMVTAQDKKIILGRDAVQVPKPHVFDAEVGMPLFWAERKSVDFWRVLVVDLGAAAVAMSAEGQEWRRGQPWTWVCVTSGWPATLNTQGG